MPGWLQDPFKRVRKKPRLRKGPIGRRAEKILERLASTLSQMHAAGLVGRDCERSHIFVHRGQVRLIDFEGACQIHRRDVLPWGSKIITRARHHKSVRRRAGVLEDDYVLGVIGFQFATGEFPPRSSRRRAASYKRLNCRDFLRARIEDLLRL